MGNDGRQLYQTTFFNLDAVLSVGYRVNSKNATQFRIWANKILKEYLVKGYAINQNVKAEQLKELKGAVKLLSNVLDAHSLSADETTGLLKVITDYTYALDTLDRYDYQKLEIESTTAYVHFRANYDNAMEAISTHYEINSGNSPILFVLLNSGLTAPRIEKKINIKKSSTYHIINKKQYICILYDRLIIWQRAPWELNYPENLNKKCRL